MATDIVIPALGESISEAVVASWLKDDGEYVERDEDIVELETDKVTMPLPAPAAGVLKHGASEGDTVEVGGSLGSIDESAEKPEKVGAAAGKKKEASAGEAGDGAAESDDEGESEAGPKAAVAKPAGTKPPEPGADATETTAGSEERASAGGAPAEDQDVRTTPLARKLAAEHHVDLRGIEGTGPSGRVREQDVLAFIQTHANGGAFVQREERAEAPAPRADRTARRERMSQLRQRIAVRLVEAQHNAAMLTTFNECDMSRVMEIRSRTKESFQERHGVKLGFMSFFVKACVSALERVPSVGSFLVQGEKGPELEYHDYADIAVAVGTDKGLVVPVLRDCQALSFAQIESGIGELAKKAREGKLTLEDMQGGTFTISNGGVYGSMLSTPILNPPQSGILGMHNILRRPVENPDKPGSGEVVVRPMMYLALSYDHRVVDGEGAVTFLRHVKECIEDPERMLVGA